MRLPTICFLVLAMSVALTGCQKAPPTSINSGKPEGSSAGENEHGANHGATPSPETSPPANGGNESSKPGNGAASPAASQNNGESKPAGTQQTFSAQLSGAEETPSVTTDASGEATFETEDDGKKLHYVLKVENLKDVTMAHIHMAAAGKNGPVVVWLYPSQPPEKLIEGVSNGKIAEGTITASNLTGPLEGKTMSDLLAKMSAGDLYVNVHTKQHGGGEIRGQLH